MCLRERPRPFSPGVTGWNTLVAMTASSRVKYLLTSLPVTTSLAPRLYTSAVSKNVTPPSTAARTMGSVSSSLIDHGLSSLFPNAIMPRQIRETRRPDCPKLAYSTFDPLCSHPPLAASAHGLPDETVVTRSQSSDRAP